MGVAYGDALSDLFYDAPPVKEFRKRYPLEKLPGTKHLLQALLKAYKEWGGKNKKPNIAILEFRQPFQTAETGESALIAHFSVEKGMPEIVSPGTARIPQWRAEARRISHRSDLPPHQGPGVSGALRSDASAAARLSQEHGFAW